MEIELSEDLQHYKESFILGLTVKQAFFSILALGTGTAVVLLLYNRIGITLSCYVATPFVVPLALTGFYHYHGLTFWQFTGKMVHFAFFNRPLPYWSTESMQELGQIVSEEKQEEQKDRNRKESPEKKAVKGIRKNKGHRKGNADSEKNKNKKNRNRTNKNRKNGNQENRVRETNQGMEIGKEPERKGKNSATGQPGKNRMRSKKKRRRGRGMVTVVKRRKPAGLIAVMVIGWILTITALLAIGAAMAAGWYGQFR